MKVSAGDVKLALMILRQRAADLDAQARDPAATRSQFRQRLGALIKRWTRDVGTWGEPPRPCAGCKFYPPHPEMPGHAEFRCFDCSRPGHSNWQPK